MDFLLTGGTGFIGSHLTEYLTENGHTCHILTRSPQKYEQESTELKKFHQVDDDSEIAKLVEKADVVINLAGENLFDKRWTDNVKQKILSSRIEITDRIVAAINAAKNKPDVFISASAVGIYGDRSDEKLSEESLTADDFLARVCREWEAAASKVDKNVRLVIPRIGIALETDGGALQKMLTPFKLFAGGPLGDGKQFFPWIHMQDFCDAMMFAIQKEDFKGVYNATSPNPLSMKDFSSALGSAMRRPSFFSVPEFVLNIALGEAAQGILASLRVYPQKLLDAGFVFTYPEIDTALKNILD